MFNLKFFLLFTCFLIFNSMKTSSSKIKLVDSRNNIVFAEAETKLSYSFSCSFNNRYESYIRDLILLKYPTFNKKMHLKNSDCEIKVEIKKGNQLKLEYKCLGSLVTDDKLHLKTIASEIKKI